LHRIRKLAEEFYYTKVYYSIIAHGVCGCNST